jgi:hypothetical protein
MATNSTGSFSSVLSAQEADLRYLLTIADRAGMFQHPVFASGYLGRADMSKTVQRPVYGLGADEMGAETEGTGASGTAIADSTVSATVAGQILVRENTQLLRNVTGESLSPSELFGMDMAVAASTRFLSMVATAMQSAAGSVGVSGADLTAATHFGGVAAYRALASLGIGGTGAPVALYHIHQVNDLETNLFTSAGGQLQYGDEARRMAAFSGGIFRGFINDVPIYGTSKVPTANAGADRSGALLGAGSIVWADQLPAIDDASRQAVLGGDAPDGSILPPMLAEIDRDSKSGITAVVGRIFLGVNYGQEAAIKVISGAT